jgi:hypothetical protein
MRIVDDESLPALARSLFAQVAAEFAPTQARLKRAQVTKRCAAYWWSVRQR